MNRAILCMAAVTVVLSGCSDAVTTLESSAEPQLAMVPVNVSAAPAITTLSITVSAADIATDLIFNLDMSGGAASDTITIPAGSSRTVTIRGFDENGIETHRGSKTVHLTEGLNPQLTIVLLGLTGELPLLVILGETNVAVTPEAVSLSVGGTAQLEAVVTDESGDTLDVAVRWGSSNPAFVTVDEAGMVSGVGLGSASVVATYGGVGAGSTVTVSDAPTFVFPTDGLVALYRFEGNANDTTGGGRDGQVLGATFEESRSGSGSAIRFAGSAEAGTNNTVVTSDQYVSIPNFGYAFGSAFTASVWANISATSTTRQLVHRRTSNNIDFALEPLYAHLGSLGIAFAPEGADVPNDEWHHFAFTYDGTSIKAFLDGVLGAEIAATGNMSANTSTVVLGKYVYYGGLTHHFFFNGLLDDLAFWNRALTPEEIAYLANN